METLKNKNILITKPENVFHTSGFQGSFGQILKTPTKTFLITDSRYKLQGEKMCKYNIEIIIISDYQSDFEQLIKKEKIKNVYFESSDFSYAKFLKFQELFPKLKLTPLKNEIDNLRLIKTEQEIKLITKSQQLNELVLKKIQPLLKPGITEREIAKKIITIGYDLGADKVSFDPIVAFGKNSASPHSTPTNTKLKPTDIILIDMGFILNNYCSDMTRTFLPKNPSTEMQTMYNLVLEAQENCLKNIKAGISGIQADNLSRSIFKKAELDQFFTHANGHGIGLQIHESPSLSCKLKHSDRKIKLQENMVVTVEPGLYFEGKFGIRIEDIVVICKNKSRNLTKFAK